MNKLLEVNRDLDRHQNMSDRTFFFLTSSLGQRERMIHRFMHSYGMDRTTAAQTYEQFQLRSVEMVFGKNLAALRLRVRIRSALMLLCKARCQALPAE